MTTETMPITDHKPRCWQCNKLLAIYVSRPWEITCRHCKKTNRRGWDAPDIDTIRPNVVNLT